VLGEEDMMMMMEVEGDIHDNSREALHLLGGIGILEELSAVHSLASLSIYLNSLSLAKESISHYKTNYMHALTRQP
jgi:hypothetical protein